MRPLEEQTILVTGSSDGHGKRVAQELAGRGATVLVHGRSREKTEAAASEIGSDEVRIADLASLTEVRRLAGEFDELDALVNNAGIISFERGGERRRPRAHLRRELPLALPGHPVLLSKLREPARIVNVSSLGQQRIDFDDLMFERGYDFFTAYARSKLAQVLFTFELAGRLDDRDVTVNALHPATFMDTKMVTGGGGSPQSSVEEGAQATLRLGADPEADGETGRFFDGRRASGTHRQANDPEARRRLWEVSERLSGLA